MAGERYNEEFKIAAVKQVTEQGHSISDVAKRLGGDCQQRCRVH